MDTRVFQASAGLPFALASRFLKLVPVASSHIMQRIAPDSGTAQPNTFARLGCATLTRSVPRSGESYVAGRAMRKVNVTRIVAQHILPCLAYVSPP